MSFSDYLLSNGVMIGTSATSKKQLVEQISDRAESLTGLFARSVFDAIMQRERLGSTAIGDGIAIPHAVFTELKNSVVILTILNNAIAFESHDKKPVDIVFTILGHEQTDCDNLKLLSKASKLFSNSEFCQTLRKATSSLEVINSFGPYQASSS